MVRQRSLRRSFARRLGVEALEPRNLLAIVPAMVVDLNTNGLGSGPSEFMVVGDQLHFVAGGEYDRTLYRYDGTHEPERLFRIGTTVTYGDRYLTGSFKLGGAMYFRSLSGELMKYDGVVVTPASDLYRSFAVEGEVDFGYTSVRFGDHDYFAGDDRGYQEYFLVPTGGEPQRVGFGRELWRTDGTTTELVADLVPGSDSGKPADFVVHDGALYFFARTPGDPQARSLWRYVGRRAYPLPGTARLDPFALTALGRDLYFFDLAEGGVDLMRFSGGAVTAVGKFSPPAEYNARYWRNVMPMVALGEALYFAANDGASGVEPWTYTGGPSPPTRVADLRPGAASSALWDLTVFRDAAYFIAYSEQAGWQMYRVDAAGWEPVTQYGPAGFVSGPFVEYQDALYFPASPDNDSDVELWRFDGQTLSQAANLATANVGSYPHSFTKFRNEVYFLAQGGVRTGDTQIWRYDGSEFHEVVNVIIPNRSIYAGGLTAAGDQLYFVNSGQVWTYDDVAIRPVSSVHTGNMLETYRPLVVYGDALYVNGVSRHEYHRIWKVEGTTAVPLTTVANYVVPANIPIETWDVVGDVVYFSNNGRWLRYDGAQVEDVTDRFPPGTDMSAAIQVEDKLYFSAYRPGSSCRTVWQGDLSGDNAVPLPSEPYPTCRDPRELTWSGGVLYFLGYQYELWRWDGGLLQRLPVIHGAAEEFLNDTPEFYSTLTSFAEAVYITGWRGEFDGSRGNELWTVVGDRVVMAADIEPGVKGSSPGGLTVIDGQMFFSATRSETGRELFTLKTVADGDLDGDGIVGLRDLVALQANVGHIPGSEYYWVEPPDCVGTVCPGHFPRPPATYQDGDLDGDGDVDRTDAAIWMRQYGVTSTPGAPRAAAGAGALVVRARPGLGTREDPAVAGKRSLIARRQSALASSGARNNKPSTVVLRASRLVADAVDMSMSDRRAILR